MVKHDIIEYLKQEDMFLEPNPMDFETLNISDLELAEQDNIPLSLAQPPRRVYSKEDEKAIGGGGYEERVEKRGTNL